MQMVFGKVPCLPSGLISMLVIPIIIIACWYKKLYNYMYKEVYSSIIIS